MRFFKKYKGFTLIELIAILAILTIIISIAVPQMRGQTKKALQTKLINDAKILEDACHLYYLDHGDQPRLSDEPLTFDELTGRLYTINFDKSQTPEEEANYYNINIEALSNYIKSFDSNPLNFVLQNPVGSVYVLDTEANHRLPGKEHLFNSAPVAVISMTPEENIDIKTIITWGHIDSTDADGDEIVDVQWTGKKEAYGRPGEYTVKLRVQDKRGKWSKWATKKFTVSMPIPDVPGMNGYSLPEETTIISNYEIENDHDASHMTGATIDKNITTDYMWTGENDMILEYDLPNSLLMSKINFVLYSNQSATTSRWYQIYVEKNNEWVFAGGGTKVFGYYERAEISVNLTPDTYDGIKIVSQSHIRFCEITFEQTKKKKENNYLNYMIDRLHSISMLRSIYYFFKKQQKIFEQKDKKLKILCKI